MTPDTPPPYPPHTPTPQHHPIFLERLGKLDGPRIEKEGVADDVILDYHLREMEYMAQVRGEVTTAVGCLAAAAAAAALILAAAPAAVAAVKAATQ
jgi:hypothetical protein